MKLDARGPGGLWRTCSAVCGLTGVVAGGGSGVDSDVTERAWRDLRSAYPKS